MKRILFFYLLLTGMMLSCWSADAQKTSKDKDYLPDWQKGYLDIHTISTGRGDAALIIMPDGTTMMIDAGDNGKNKQYPDSTKSAAEWQATYMQHFMSQLPEGKNLDYALLTHFHNDHMGCLVKILPGTHGYGLSGMTEVGELIHFNKYVDRGYPDYNFPTRKNVLNANKGFIPEYLKFIDYQKAQGTKMEKFQIGSTDQFKMIHDPKAYSDIFEIRNLAANGQVWTGKGLNSKRMYSGDTTLFDENMNSCAFKLTYGKFAYFNGGDLSGNNWPIFKSMERDFESQVGKVCGNVTVMKANHHGYYDTCNPFFLNDLCPKVIIIDARSNNHPVPTTMARIVDHQVWGGDRDYYITVDAPRKKLGEDLWSKFKPWGHIVVRVYPGGEKYQVFVLDAHSKDYHIIYKSDIVNL